MKNKNEMGKEYQCDRMMDFIGEVSRSGVCNFEETSFSFSFLILVGLNEDVRSGAEAVLLSHEVDCLLRVMNNKTERAWVPGDWGAIVPTRDSWCQHLRETDDTSVC